MKIFTLTLGLLFSGLVLKASPYRSELVINSNINSLIKVSIDRGALSAASPSVTFFNLHPGEHWITVVTPNPGYGYGANEIVFNGPVHIAPRSKTRAVVNRFGKFNIQAEKPLFQVHNQ